MLHTRFFVIRLCSWRKTSPRGPGSKSSPSSWTPPAVSRRPGAPTDSQGAIAPARAPPWVRHIRHQVAPEPRLKGRGQDLAGPPPPLPARAGHPRDDVRGRRGEEGARVAVGHRWERWNDPGAEVDLLGSGGGLRARSYDGRGQPLTVRCGLPSFHPIAPSSHLAGEVPARPATEIRQLLRPHGVTPDLHHCYPGGWGHRKGHG